MTSGAYQSAFDSAIGAVLCGSMLYSAIRYGLNDFYTRLALVVAGLCILITFTW